MDGSETIGPQRLWRGTKNGEQKKKAQFGIFFKSYFSIQVHDPKNHMEIGGLLLILVGMCCNIPFTILK